jgi:hypothetical protein
VAKEISDDSVEQDVNKQIANLNAKMENIELSFN